MGRVFGGLALVFSIIIIVASAFVTGFLPSAVSMLYIFSFLVIILGIIGIVKDDPKGVAVAGVCFGIVAIVLIVIFTDLWQMMGL